MGYDFHESGDHLTFVVLGATAVADSVRTPARRDCRKAVEEKPNASATTAAKQANERTAFTPIPVNSKGKQTRCSAARSARWKWNKDGVALRSTHNIRRIPSRCPFFAKKLGNPGKDMFVHTAESSGARRAAGPKGLVKRISIPSIRI